MSIKSIALAGILAVSFMPPTLPAFAQDKGIVDPSASVKVENEPAYLELDQAIAWALDKSPVLAASSARADASNASRSQAGALPNPEISIEADNIYGDGPYEGMDSAEITYGVSQLIELPGKRGNRVRLADAERTKTHYARDSARLDLIRDVTIAFSEVTAAQQEVVILEEERNLAFEVYESVSAKVQAGKVPPIQKNKAQIELSSSDIALERARRNLNARAKVLEALMGGEIGRFKVSMDSLPELMEPQAYEVYHSRLQQTPDFKSLDADVLQAKAGLSLEKANSFPDPTLNFGIKNFEEDDTEAFVAGLSFPLPVFNMNRTGIKRAGHELNATILDQRGSQLALEATLVSVYNDFSSAFNEARALKTSVLSGAEESFRFAHEGYEAGKFDYLEVLDAQRTLFDARKQLNQSILDYHNKRAVIERMTAIHAEQHHNKDEGHE
ncbi:TolC family protein [Micavibrio aeruginosavorus]|uniref:TolC family protein n=1 Tax=Micavibrio aeruginosavorus TaxID=349221 RepID=UPI003F4AED5F